MGLRVAEPGEDEGDGEQTEDHGNDEQQTDAFEGETGDGGVPVAEMVEDGSRQQGTESDAEISEGGGDGNIEGTVMGGGETHEVFGRGIDNGVEGGAAHEVR